jgi:phosphotriesterase-related protein
MANGLIRTVLGDIRSTETGVCQCHEHLFLEMGKSYQISGALFMDDLKKSTEELKSYRQAGGGLVLDAQPVFAGRMAENLVAASKDSGVHVVASTGFHKTIFYEEDAYIFYKNEQDITELFIGEFESGMLSSQRDGQKTIHARVGAIKTAVDSGGIFKDKVYTKLFAAAANAAVKTGLPVVCHIEQGEDALAVLDFFMKRGVDPERLVICHLDRARYDVGYHKEVAETGAYLEYDTINRPKYLSNRREIELIVQMLGAGLEDRLLLSLDTTNERLRAYGADMGLDYILKTFVPMLKAAGADRNQILKMQSKNAQSVLEIKR